MPSSDRNPKSGRRPPRDAFERRTARNKMVIIFMAVLMALSLLAVPLTQLLS